MHAQAGARAPGQRGGANGASERATPRARGRGVWPAVAQESDESGGRCVRVAHGTVAPWRPAAKKRTARAVSHACALARRPPRATTPVVTASVMARVSHCTRVSLNRDGGERPQGSEAGPSTGKPARRGCIAVVDLCTCCASHPAMWASHALVELCRPVGQDSRVKRAPRRRRACVTAASGASAARDASEQVRRRSAAARGEDFLHVPLSTQRTSTLFDANPGLLCHRIWRSTHGRCCPWRWWTCRRRTPAWRATQRGITS